MLAAGAAPDAVACQRPPVPCFLAEDAVSFGVDVRSPRAMPSFRPFLR